MTLFGIGTFDNKVKEVLMTNDDLHQIFDENGQHKLNKFSKEPKLDFDVDFTEGNFKFIVIIPRIIKISANKVIGSLENARKEVVLSKDFKISSDFNKVTVDETEYTIPSYYSRAAMKAENKKAWEMIFGQIFRAEICKNMAETLVIQRINEQK